ncbi:MAG TPA: ABC transporter ATP-binding protein [Candidatus Limnocylindrales bacterium]|nr:ABC transporter ATP-binding protein [Candidatus Limnocylindrales bacterium]
MAAPAISVEAIVKFFPPALAGWRALLQPFSQATRLALSGVSFEVAPGEAVALVGPNGAGKSTLLRILATLIIPTRGCARMGGFDVERDAASARRQLGYHTGGDEGFYGRLTARENLAFFAAMNNLTGAGARDRIERVARMMGISDELPRQVRTLSTGMTHRLGLARALLHGPGILLLDEPTRSLDPIAASDFRRLLKEDLVRRHGTTLLFASHSLAEVGQIADRVAVLDQGKVVALDSPQGLLRSTGTATLEAAIAKLVRHVARQEVET